MDPIIISTIIIVSATLIYKIAILFYASKCNVFKCSLRNGVEIQRNIEKEQSIRHLGDVELKVSPATI